jgi:hypothetical protein
MFGNLPPGQWLRSSSESNAPVHMSPIQLRSAIDSADGPIRAALRDGDMDLAQTLVSRKVGWRILLGEVVVKLKRHRL